MVLLNSVQSLLTSAVKTFDHTVKQTPPTIFGTDPSEMTLSRQTTTVVGTEGAGESAETFEPKGGSNVAELNV